MSAADTDELCVVAPGLFCSWQDGQVRIGTLDDPLAEFVATPGVVVLLSVFSAPCSRADAYRRLTQLGVPAPDRAVEQLIGMKLLVPAHTTRSGPDGHASPASAYDVIRQLGTTHDIDALAPQFTTLFADIEPFTLTSKPMAFALYQAVNYLEANNIGGAIVECGVAAGGSMMLAAATLLTHHRCERDLFLFDTFDWSFEQPCLHDGFVGTTDTLTKTPGAQTRPCGVSVQQVTANMATTGYPSKRIHLVPGMVQDTLASTPTGDIALLRLDTDFYESTRCELETLYPRLVPGAVLILDDYGKLKGATTAADEYFNQHPNPPLLHRIETQGRIATKPSDVTLR